MDGHVISWAVVYENPLRQMSKLSNFRTDYIAYKTQNIYSLSFYREKKLVRP